MPAQLRAEQANDRNARTVTDPRTNAPTFDSVLTDVPPTRSGIWRSAR
jgi:16S rRNA C967 or C1407 C5-methylase (RsmB/RsmF family)